MCGSVSGGGVCYSGDSVGSVAVYFCDDGCTLDPENVCPVASGMEPQCVETDRNGMHECKNTTLTQHCILY